MGEKTSSPTQAIGLGDSTAWSPVAFLVTIIVSTATYGFGNPAAVIINPLITLGTNAAVTATIFGLAAGVVRLVGDRLPRRAVAWVVLGVVAVLSAARGVALWAVMGAVGVDGLPEVWVSALVSVSVFGLGFVLSVLVVAWVGRWRTNQARVRELAEQRRALRAFVDRSIASHTAELTKRVRDSLGPQLDALRSQNTHPTPGSLINMVTAVVRPLSHQLHQEFPDVTLPPVKTALVSAKDFIHLAVTGTPFAPVVTGALFSLGLAPRNLSEGVSLGAVVWTVGIGVAVGVGVWLLNLASARFFTRLTFPLHTAILVVLLISLGLLISHLPALFDPEEGSSPEYYLAGPVATVLFAVLVGGVTNARKYFRWQESQLTSLERQIAHEMAAARGVLWARNHTLATILHGPLQSTINAAAIRLARATSPKQAEAVTDGLAADVEQILHSLHSPTAIHSDLVATIANIQATWEDITDITWSVDDRVVAMVRGTPVEQAISDCVVEATYNAIKHQSPKKIFVTLATPTPEEIVLTVTHHGVIGSPVSGGLGTRILDYLTLDHSLTEKDGVVEFRGVFAVPTPTDSDVSFATNTAQ